MEEDILGRIIPIGKDNYYNIEIKDLSHKVKEEIMKALQSLCQVL